MPDPFILSHIRRLPLFAGCNEEQLAALSDAFTMYRYAPGQVLYQQGERSQALFLFVSGLGQLLRNTGDGQNRFVAHIQPGQFIGEGSLGTPIPRDVTAQAIQESVVLVLYKQNLDTLAAARPDIAAVLGAISPAPSAPAPTQSASRSSGRREFGGFFPPTVWVDGRRIVYHKHRLILLRYLGRPIFGYVLLILLLAIAGSFRAQLGDLASPGFLIVFSLIWLAVNSFLVLWEYLTYLGDVYIIDDESVTDVRRAPFGLREYRAQASLWQVQNVTSAIKNIIGRVFNYGDVIIQTAATQGATRLDFTDIPNPTGVANEINIRMRALDSRRR
jgi:hypothetical protein